MTSNRRPFDRVRLSRLGCGASLTALGWALVATAAPAQTQPAADTQAGGATQVGEVVVTGIRKSQVDAIKVKRASEEIVEVISAEDIGKLPDNSIADSIARLPGLAAQRNNSGRTQDISIDGLPSSMNTTLLNGFMQATTDNNRTTQFDQYPSEIMSSVVVYKTGDAALTGAAIGTVDMRTVRPLDYGKSALFVGAQGEYATAGKLQPGANDTGYRANVTYITQFDDDKVGVMFGYSHTLTPNEITSVHPYGYFVANSEFEGGTQYELRSDTLARDGFVATVQYKPNENLEFTVDGFDSTYNDNAIIRGAEVQNCNLLTAGSTTNCNGSTATLTGISNGVSSWTGLAPQLLSDDFRESAHLRAADFTVNYNLGGGWKVHGDYGYSEAHTKFDQLELYSGFGLNGQQSTTSATFTEGAGPGGTLGVSNWSENLQSVALGENLGWSNYIPSNFPGACIGGKGMAAPGWSGSAPCTAIGGINADQIGGAGQDQIQRTNDVIQQTRWSIGKDLSGPISHVEVGAAYSVRKKDYARTTNELYLNSGNEAQPIPTNWLLAPTNLSVFGLPNMFSIDPTKAFASGQYGYVEDIRDANADWWVSEHVFTPYIKFNVNTQVGGHDLVGNFGLQAVDTSQTVTNVAQTNTQGTVFTNVFYKTTTKYWEILPSFNLTWRMGDNQDIRLAAGRSLARPRFDQLGGGSNISYNITASSGVNPWSGNIANPTLRPWISDDVEISYERYFAPGEGVTIQGFYKNLESYIYQSTANADFSAYAAAAGITLQPGQPITGPVTEYVNGSGGALYGVVVSGNFQLKHLSPILDGFGISGSATYTESTVHIPVAPGCSAIGNLGTYQTPCQSGTPDGKLPQYSKYVANVGFYWEKNGLSLRINDRYRSTYDQEVIDFNGGLQPIIGAAENIIDFQAGYDIRSGRLKNLSFTFSAENLTNAAMNSYTGAYNSTTGVPTAATPKDTVYYKTFGTNLLFGVRYKY